MAQAEDGPNAAGRGRTSVNETAPASPAVEAFRTLIRSSIQTLEQPRSEPSPDDEALLFLGAWSDALPRMLIEDPVLAPTDKVVWQVIKLHASAQSPTAFPNYQTIGRLANVRAQATIARAIAILRTARWLTLCARVRDRGGRFRGNVYALHDEPLALADTLHLDPEYMRFLESAVQHQHGRVRSVAAAALATIEDEVHRGTDVTKLRNPIERRVEALGTVHARGQGGFYSFNRHRLEQLRQRVPTTRESPAPSLPTSEIERRDPKESESRIRLSSTTPLRVEQKNYEDGDVLRSSSFIKKTTTTNAVQPSKNISPALALHFPERLSDNHEAVARMYLDRIPEHSRQAVLDELEGRLRAERRGAPAVYDPLRFLKKLCDAASSGTFVENHGVAVRAGRERERRADERVHNVNGVAVPDLPPLDPNHPLVQWSQHVRAKQAARKHSP